MNTQSKSHRTIRSLCEGALMIALAEILSILHLPSLPQGGSVELAMLPIFIFCTRWGVGPGLLVGSAHGFIQMMMEGGIAIGWQSIVGDFLLAYLVLGFAGLFWKMKKGYYVGVFAGCLLRFLVHYVVGATIWAEYMPPVFFSMTMTTPWIYSALYNGVYMVPDCILCLLIGWLLMKTPAQKYLKPLNS